MDKDKRSPGLWRVGHGIDRMAFRDRQAQAQSAKHVDVVRASRGFCTFVTSTDSPITSQKARGLSCELGHERYAQIRAGDS